MGLVVKYLMMLVFILDYFQEKLIIKYCKKTAQNSIFGPFWALFCPKLGKNDFSWEKGLSQLLNITIVYDPAKNQK